MFAGLGALGVIECKLIGRRLRCDEIVEDGCLVVYGVVGLKPDYPYIRAEWRGYDLQLIAHYGCWYKKKPKMSKEELDKLAEEFE